MLAYRQTLILFCLLGYFSIPDGQFSLNPFSGEGFNALGIRNNFRVISQSGIVALGAGLLIIAGEFDNRKGPASSFSPINLFNINLNKGKGTSLSFDKSHNTGLLIIKGNVTINNIEKVPTNHFVLFNNDGTEFTLRADENSIILVLSGEPIDEPIASYGPFVMNTNEEIKQTIDDFNSGKFGYLD